jgi:DNA-binding Lrp family transcriptional regulator
MPLAQRSIEQAGEVFSWPKRPVRDCHLSSNRLAEAVGLSATPCLRRLRRLKGDGYLRSFGAELDIERFGSHLCVFVEIRLRSRSSVHARPFEDYAHRHAQILDCTMISGDFDYMVRVVARDVVHFQALTQDMLESCPGVEHYREHISLKSVKHVRDLLLSIFEPALWPAG